MKTSIVALLVMLMLGIFSSSVFAQEDPAPNPDPPSGYPTIAVDAPSGYTDHLELRLYNTGSYPSADSLNQNMIDIDNAVHGNRLALMLISLFSVVCAGAGIVWVSKQKKS